MNTKEIEQKAKRLKVLRNRQDILQTEIDRLENELKTDMETKGVEELHAGPFTVVWKMIRSRRFDTKRCKEEHPELYELYTVISSYRKFGVI